MEKFQPCTHPNWNEKSENEGYGRSSDRVRKEKVLGGVGEIGRLQRRSCGRSRGVAGYKENVLGVVGELPDTKKKLRAE